MKSLSLPKARKIDVRVCMIFSGYFILLFVMQMKNLNAAWFGIDELDIMLGGKAIANGYILYRDFASQHMPFSYYLAAVFDLLGNTSVTLQRIAFYAFFAATWTSIVVRYRKIVNQWALALYPILFLFVIATYDMGHAILSEHLAGIGATILFLEFYSFSQTNQIDAKNCIWISASIVLTVGTLFISIFAFPSIIIGIIICEIKWARNKEVQSGIFKHLWRRYIPLLVVILIPWVILCVHYIIHDNLGRFIQDAYVQNRTIYAKYIGGYGSSVFSTLLGFPENIAHSISGFLNISQLTIIPLIQFLLTVLVLIHIVKKFINREFLLASVQLFVWFGLSNRATFNYHGTHWVAFSCLIAAIELVDLLHGRDENTKENGIYIMVRRISAVLSTIVMSLPFLGSTSNLAFIDLSTKEDPRAAVADYVLEKGEGMWQISMDNSIFMNANIPAVYNKFTTPWGWEDGGKAFLEEIVEKSPPKVAYYDPNHEVWGYKLREYAPEIVSYMSENYTQYEESNTYIRNDYYQRAYRAFNPEMAYKNKDISGGVIGEILDNTTVEQYFRCEKGGTVSSAYLCTATYMRKNECDIELVMTDLETGIQKKLGSYSCEEMADNDFSEMKFDPYDMEEGKMYSLKITSPNASVGNAITIYRGGGGFTGREKA